jgi:hypothetical protein
MLVHVVKAYGQAEIKRIVPFILFTVVGQLPDLAASSLGYETGVVPRYSLDSLKKR